MVKHYIITNRLITTHGDQEKFYKVNDEEYLRIDGSEQARDEIRYGTISFNNAQNTKFTIEIYKDPSENVMKNYIINRDRPERPKLGSEVMFNELYELGCAAEKREDILVFIHGYKTDLNNALETLKHLHDTYVENEESPIKHIVLFTWPAKEKILEYRDDVRDAVISGYALARAISKLKDLYSKYFSAPYDIKPLLEPCDQKVHLMCHSMGNRVLESMFMEMESMKSKINNLCGEIFLMAADIDYDAIHEPKPLSHVIDMAERVHIYYHNHDRALGISEKTKNAFNRLGRWGAKNSLKLPDGVFQSNVTGIRDEKGLKSDFVHHWYYIDSVSVAEDIIDVLNGKTSIFSAEF
ncbi:alpha/beta hydrolase [Fulvivirga maritima]|uniref:alpha/beta hydrolase n=1 Tax=Fulvivirga maritima TaxID=2904247 RepID=UPI001F3D42F7|nr:alpha/beta hydrolase [Fulvivirga maritima]UII25908.1 alpha/beta hydrolase [Fulvivirga maritima]